MAIEKGNKTTINAWAFYDWANSAYPLVITTAIFPIYYANMTSGTDAGIPGSKDLVEFFGVTFHNTELKSYVLSFSFLIISVMSPLLSGIADYTGKKKQFMKGFCYTGALGCASLYFFDPEHLEWGMLSFMIATIGFWGSLVFYNAFLPEIAHPRDHDRVSAKGYALGYIGSSILLIMSLIAIMNHEALGFASKAVPTRLAFVGVGIWWAGFAQITFRTLPNNVYHRRSGDRVLSKGFHELKAVWHRFKGLKRVRRYLYAFFTFNMGVQTVMLVAVDFGKKEIPEMPDNGMIVSVLIIQFIAIAGAYAFSYLSGRIFNIRALAVALFIWIAICVFAYFIQTPQQFYLLAGLVGLVMGGIQSLARATYAKFLPHTMDHASFFSFYDVSEKIGIMTGTFLYGFIEGITGDMRNSVLLLIVLFVLGLIFLSRVPSEESPAEPNKEP